MVSANPGYGWNFEPLRKPRRAVREDYFRFRLLLEPALILEPSFVADPGLLKQAREEQLALLDTLDAEFDISHLYEANERFHGMFIAFCQNRFIVKALSYEGPVPRLPEYRHYQDRQRIRTACQEHIAIIDAILAGDPQIASDLMRAHIAAAQQAGSVSNVPPPQPGTS
jgi:DNA-binding GntR family transcriptional regulator